MGALRPRSLAFMVVALIACFVVLFTVSPAVAQKSRVQPVLRSVVPPGAVVWITDSQGREIKVQIVDVTDDEVALAVGEQIRRVPTAEVRRVRVSKSDAVVNGALIGAGAAIASGLLLCRLTEPWEICNDPGPIIRIGVVGAGIGIGIDALIRGRKTIYDVRGSSTRLRAAPLIGQRASGLQITVQF